jgi:hypothetical protein
MRLPLKRPLIILGASAIVLGALLAWLNWRFSPRIGPVEETWETSNKHFKIRVDNHTEEHAFLPGAYYVFRAAPIDSDAWRDIMTFRYDDPGPIRRDQVQFINDRVAFIYMGWMFAATSDGGATWSVSDMCNNLPNGKGCNYRLISNVQLHADGSGTMSLDVIEDTGYHARQLRTTDFGCHWSV